MKVYKLQSFWAISCSSAAPGHVSQILPEDMGCPPLQEISRALFSPLPLFSVCVVRVHTLQFTFCAQPSIDADKKQFPILHTVYVY